MFLPLYNTRTILNKEEIAMLSNLVPGTWSTRLTRVLVRRRVQKGSIYKPGLLDGILSFGVCRYSVQQRENAALSHSIIHVQILFPVPCNQTVGTAQFEHRPTGASSIQFLRRW